MPMFRYEATDASGKVLHGAMQAGNEAQLEDNLRTRGMTLRSIYPPNGVQPSPPPVAAGQLSRGPGVKAVTVGSGVPISIKSLIPPRTLSMFFRQLSTTVRSGISLSQSLSQVHTASPRLRTALLNMQPDLERGGSLSSAMARYPHVFPVHVISSVWSGELNGRLDIALAEIATEYEQETADTFYGKIGWGITKLTLISMVIALPAANVSALLTPALQTSLDTGGAVTTNQVLGQIWHTLAPMLGIGCLLSLGLIAFWYVWGYMKRVPSIKMMLDTMILKVPIWGAIHRNRALARFTRVLGSLYDAGINQSLAWEAASLVPRNAYIADRLKSVSGRSSTEGISQLMQLSTVFPMDEVSMIATGERSGDVNGMLTQLSTTYESNAQSLKSVGRMASFSALTCFSIILGGVILAQLLQSYSKFIFEVADKIGQ